MARTDREITDIDPRWHATIASFLQEGSTGVERHEDGWSIEVEVSPVRFADELLADAPRGFVDQLPSCPMEDLDGRELDVEFGFGLLSCAREHAILQRSRHYSAGLVAELAVYETVEGYHQALEEKLN